MNEMPVARTARRDDKPSAEGVPFLLELIRAAEAEVTRKVAASYKAAEQRIAEAQQQADQLKREAQEAGYHEGRAQYAEAMRKAHETAAALLDQAQQRGKKIHHKGERNMDALVAFFVEFIAKTASKEE